MNSIYTHLSPDKFSFAKELSYSNYTFSKIPDYAEHSFKQTEFYLKEPPFVVTNEYIDIFYDEINDFYNLCKIGFPSFYKDTFWLMTLIRLYITFLYAKKNNIEEFLHLEYDNLIYSDLTLLKQLPKSVYFTRVGPFCSSAGFVYCNSLLHFEKFIYKIQSLLKKGEKNVRLFTQYDHLSEMIFIDLIQTHSQGIIDYLPILPFGIGDDNFAKLQVLFDGASYGQYLGGTNNGDKEGYYGLHHYIGQQIHNKKIDIFFDKVPFVKVSNNNIPILNLHIHSKNLKKFITYDK